MDYGLIIIMSLASFALLNTAPIIGAWMFAGKIAGNKYMHWALTGFLFLLESLLICGSCGVFGLLNLQGAVITSSVVGVIFILLAKVLPQTPQPPPPGAQPTPPPSYAERIMEIMTYLIGVIICMKSAYLLGTDTMLYHLYYPAMWIDAGSFFAIPMQGLPHEYFPICGEVLYTWLLFGSIEPTLVSLLQPATTLMALLAMAGLLKTFRIPSFYIKVGILLLMANGIIIENVSMCYTDTLTGALLLTGICFLLQGMWVKDQSKLASYIFTAAGATAMGLCAAVKYSGLVLAPVITFLLLLFMLVTDIRAKEFYKRWQLYILSTITAIIAAGVFYLPNYLKTGNPFYPVKIPFLFSNGVDFERSTVKLDDLYSLFVNSNPWSMSLISALLFLLLPLAALAAAWKLRKQEKSSAHLLAALAIILAAAEIIMLMIYPAATQARQIIPYLMALSLLFAPVIFTFIPDLQSNSGKALIISAVIMIICVLTASSSLYLTYLSIAATAIACSAILALFRNRKGVLAVNIFIVAVTVLLLFFCWYMRWAFSQLILKKNTDPVIINGIMQLRSDYKTSGKPLKIASSGTWFNYHMMLNMPGNQVHCVPVNAENTLSAHLVSDVKKLREPVEYTVWFERLKQGNFTHLVIQLDSHQDYPGNRELELKWALEHPEIFQLFSNNKNVWFFSIKY